MDVVKYKRSDEKPRSGETMQSDELFWDHSAASKSFFLFDDDNENATWTFSNNNLSSAKNPASNDIKTLSTSETSSLESIQRIELAIPGSKNKQNSFKAEKTKVTLNSNIQELLPISSIISSIVRGRPYILEMYKGKEVKLALLDTAIASGDGNAIIAAVLHLRETVKTSIFNQQMFQRPEAISHYINFLTNHYDFDDLYNFYVMLGRTEDAAMLKLKLALSNKNPEQKIASLENCLKFHFVNDHSPFNFYSDLILEQITILQKQLAISKNNEQLRNQAATVAPQSEVVQEQSRTLIGLPLITSLFYCTLYHYNDTENSFSSPVSLKKSHQLSDKQFTWTVVAALAQKKDWAGVQSLLTSKTLFGGSKLKSCIGFDNIAELLHNAGAPSDVTIKYLKQLDSTEDRLEVAKRLMCHTLVADTYVIMKDAQGLMNYKSQLKQGTHEYSYIENALRASTVKWKN